jgi:hypothetical protein
VSNVSHGASIITTESIICVEELDLKAYYSDRFVLPLHAGHRFPIEKYRLLRQRIVEAALIAPDELQESPAATDAEILRVLATIQFALRSVG